MQITAEMFEAATGHPPEQDDLERANCLEAGRAGHSLCGWNQNRNMPNWMMDVSHLRGYTASAETAWKQAPL